MKENNVISAIDKARPGFNINKIAERSKFYIVDLLPKGYKKSMGIVCNAAVKVDKKTGEVTPYNPLLDGD